MHTGLKSVSVFLYFLPYFNSLIKFVILLTVNHTILIMLVRELSIGSTNYPQIDIFFILITYLHDIVLIL